jgi:hypothetical protein
MKKSFKVLLAAAVIASAPAMNASPDITSLLKGALGGSSTSTTTSSSSSSDNNSSSLLSGLQGLVQGLTSTSNLSTSDLVGTWKYSNPAVTFQSTDLLQQAGGSAASGVIVNKLSPYYKKVGLNNLVATFNSDNTFSFKLKRGTISGTFEQDTEAGNGYFIFHIQTTATQYTISSFEGYVTKSGNKLTITFDASKIVTILNTIASTTNQSSLQTVSSLLSAYDGILCGFELTKSN